MEKLWLANYEEGIPAKVEIPDHPITQNLLKSATLYPRNTALIFGNVVDKFGDALMDAKMDYQTLLDLTRRFASVLQRLGINKGDRVALYLPNCPQFVIAYYATLMVGGIIVPCNPTYVARELKHQLKDSGAKVLVTLSLMYPNVKQIRADTPLQRCARDRSACSCRINSDSCTCVFRTDSRTSSSWSLVRMGRVLIKRPGICPAPSPSTIRPNSTVPNTTSSRPDKHDTT